MFRSDLLPGTETFIRSQVEALRQWQPSVIGLNKVQSVLSRPSDTVILQAYEEPNLASRYLRRFTRSRAIFRAIKDMRPQVVHAHFAMDGILVNSACARLRIPLIVSVYGMDVTALAARSGVRGIVYRIRLRRMFRRATKILAVSDFLARAAIELGAPREKTVVHRLGIHIPTEVPAGRADCDWDVLVVGRLIGKKGIDDLLRASIQTKSPEGTALRVAIVGDGPIRGELEKLATDIGASATFFGSQSPNEIQALMHSSKMLAVPSKTAADGDREGLPMILLEAAANGLPIVATRHSGIPEFVSDGLTGLLSAEADVDGLARNIQRLLEDEVLRTKLSSEARRKVSEEYSLVLQANRLEAFYDDAIGVHES